MLYPVRRLAGRFALVCVWLFMTLRPAPAAIVFDQLTSSTSGNLIPTSWMDPEGTDSDWYVYDSFTLATTQSISEVYWRGGYGFDLGENTISNFRVAFYDSIAGGSEPYVNNPQFLETDVQLQRYYFAGNCGETSIGNVGGTPMYGYHAVLPTPFIAGAGHKYWLRILAGQPSLPSWGIGQGAGGNNQHFRFSTGLAMFQFATGDTAFQLVGTAIPVTMSGFQVE